MEEGVTSSGVQGPAWQALTWSAWYEPYLTVIPRRAIAPVGPTLYRIRAGGTGLIYLGETGSFRQRVRQLLIAMRHAKAGDPRHRPPHVAGACVFAHTRRGTIVEVSWAEVPDLSRRDRKGTECELIAAYRQASGTNPTCQFAGDLEES